MTIDIDDIRVKDFFAEVIAIAIRRHEETLRPQGKTINQSQAKEYLKRVGFEPSDLKKMIQANLITPVKMGESRNSSVKFSTKQFYSAVDKLRVNNKYSMLNAGIK